MLASRSSVSVRWYSKNEDSSDDEQTAKNKKEIANKKSNDALKKLNKLLESMPTTKSSQTMNMITAKNKREQAAESKKKFVDEDSKNIK